MVLSCPAASSRSACTSTTRTRRRCASSSNAELAALIARLRAGRARARPQRRARLVGLRPADALHRPPLPRLPRAGRTCSTPPFTPTQQVERVPGGRRSRRATSSARDVRQLGSGTLRTSIDALARRWPSCGSIRPSASRVRSMLEASRGPPKRRVTSGSVAPARSRSARSRRPSSRPSRARRSGRCRARPCRRSRTGSSARPRGRARRPSRPGARRRTRRRSRPGRRRTGSTTSIRSLGSPAPSERRANAERRAASVSRSARVSVIDDRRRALGPRALRDQQPDRPRADDQHALPGRRARGARACSATDVGSTSAAARGSSSTRCANAAGNTSREAIAPSMCTMPGLGAPRAQVLAARAAAHADAAADRDLPHDAVARREPGARPRPTSTTSPVHSWPGHDRVRRDPHPEVGQRALEDLDVGAADADGGRRDQQLALARGRVGPLDQLEPFVAVELDRVHGPRRIEQPSKELRTADDGDGTRQRP